MKQKNIFKKLLTLVILLAASTTGAWADNVTGTLALNSEQTSPVVSNNVTFTWSSANIAINNAKSSGFKASSNMTITIPEGATLVNISKTNGNNWGNGATIYVYAGSDNTGTNIASIVMGTNSYDINSSNTGTTYYFENSTSKNAWITSLSITYTTGGGTPTVVTPTFLPAAGTYNKAQSVSISCATDGATIRYTTDGNDPTESSDIYSSPISVTTTGTTIKAKAFKAEMDASSVATATYTIKPTTPTITGGANVTITGDEGCTFYYTTATGSDTHTDPNNESTEYTAPFTPADGTKIKAIAYDAYGNKSDVTSVFTFKYMPLNPKNINSNYYVKVTDASTLENGDAILIVCEEHNSAMSTTQNPNNRSDASVSIASGVIKSPSASVQKIVLVKKTEKISDADTDVFYFYTGAEGYLYAASSSKNYLRTEVLPSENARATISISSGDATILFTGTNANKWLKHNYSGTSNLFSCYPTTNTTMDIVQIYKEVASVDVTDAKYATYVTACDVDFAASTGVTAYKVTGANGKIELEEVDAAPKGTPLVIAAEENTYVLNVAASEPTEVTGNLLKAADGNQTGDGAGNFYVLGKDSQGKVGFGPLASGVTLAKGKAYINGDDVSAKTFLPFVIGDEENETTSINSIENSELRIENYDYFNLSGQRVGKGYKGIVVVNGKKFVRK